MKLIGHFPEIGLSNTYLIACGNSGPAVLVDPGCFDQTLLELIEGSGFYISGVLITHNHTNHVRGLNTLLKIYDAAIIAGSKSVMGYTAQKVSQGDTGAIDNVKYKVLHVEGHSEDSRIYSIGPFLFTGDMISAGRVGSSPTPQAEAVLRRTLTENLLTLREDFILLPGHGPPTTVGAERKFNLGLTYPPTPRPTSSFQS